MENTVFFLDEALRKFLCEDIGTGDLTTLLTIDDNQTAEAFIVAKDDMVLAGMPFVEKLFHLYDPLINFNVHLQDSSSVHRGTALATVQGKVRSLLATERVALNVLQRLSGIATLTQKFVSATVDLPVKIVDTRKTTPGMRIFEKYAVTMGGGINHRFGLFDGILIKDNHIKAAGGIKQALSIARQKAPHLMKIEVEVRTIDELKQALEVQSDVIMLDNMSVEDVAHAVEITNKKALLEVSGGINLYNVRQYALTGVDIISIGALTHSAPAVDIGMDIL
jgi:nicotinate-nucleotide pyrophosphorylase (carboxylating)